MNNSLSKQTIAIIKNSAELITQNDVEISIKMYERLFSKYPELQKLFEDRTPQQYMRLAETLSAYAINIDRIDRLRPALEAMEDILGDKQQ